MGIQTNLNVSPFYDDFSPLKNYYRILFRPSVALQARELNQIQDILQGQIEYFGDNIFVQGTIISGCNFTFDDNYNYIKIPDLLISGEPVNVGQFIGYQLVDPTSNLTALVVNGTSGFQTQNPNLNTLYVKYLNTGTINAVPKAVFANSDVLTVMNPITNTAVSSLAVAVDTGTYAGVNTNPIGLGYSFSVGAGVIYQEGNFINVPANLSVIIDAYSNQPNNVVVGFSIEENIITENQDTSLFDNADGFSNENAPGAWRLQLEPTLITVNANAIPANGFLTIVEWENGQVVRSNQTSQYNVIQDTMAQRTFEQAGNYVVQPYTIGSVDINGNSTYLALPVSAGISYVQGYRVQTDNQIFVPLRKGTDTITSTGQLISTDFGNYALVTNFAGEFTTTSGSTIYLQDTAGNTLGSEAWGSISTAPGNNIGTARVYAVELDPASPVVAGAIGAQYRLYLTDIKMNIGKNFSNVAAFYSNTGSVYACADAYVAANTPYTLNDTTFNSLLFTFGNKATAHDANNASYTYRTLSSNTFTANSSANIAISLTGQPGTPLYPYGAGVNGLDSDQEKEFLLIPRGTSNVYASNGTAYSGTVVCSNSNVNVTGTSTTFTTQFAPGDYIYVNTDIRQVAGIVNNTFLTVDRAFSTSWNANAASKVYVNSVPIPIAGRNSNIVVANNTYLTIHLYNQAGTAEVLANSMACDVYYNVTQDAPTLLAKTISRANFSVIDTANNAGNTVGPWCLGVPDIFQITAVYKHSGAISTSNSDLVTNQFVLSNGQKDTLYDLAYLKLVPGAQLTINSGDYLTVQYDVFTTASPGGYFTVDSYPIDDVNLANTSAIQTAQIPVYISKTTGTTYDLRNYVDFRPYISNTVAYTTNALAAAINPANTSVFPNSNLYLPATNYSYKSDITYYLGRYAKLTIDSSGMFGIIDGLPSINPTVPLDNPVNMTIATINVAPYPTLSTIDAVSYNRLDYSVNIDVTETPRFTMKDISNIKTSVDSLEYYTSLNLLEQSLTSLNIVSPVTGLTLFQNGIYVDNFASLGNNASIAIDPIEGSILPPVIQTPINLVPNGQLTLPPAANQIILAQSLTTGNLSPVASPGTQYNYTSSTYSPPAYIFSPAVNVVTPITIPAMIAPTPVPVTTQQQTVLNPNASSTLGGTQYTIDPVVALPSITLSTPYALPLVQGLQASIAAYTLATGSIANIVATSTLTSTKVSSTAATTLNYVPPATYGIAVTGLKPNSPVYPSIPSLSNLSFNVVPATLGSDVSSILPLSQQVALTHFSASGNASSQLMTDNTGTLTALLHITNNVPLSSLTNFQLSYFSNTANTSGVSGGTLNANFQIGNSPVSNSGIMGGSNPFTAFSPSVSQSINSLSGTTSSTSTVLQGTTIAQFCDLDWGQAGQTYYGNDHIYYSSVDLYFGASCANAVGGVTVSILDQDQGNAVVTTAYVNNSVLRAAGSANGSVVTNVPFKLVPATAVDIYIAIQADGNDPNVTLWTGPWGGSEKDGALCLQNTGVQGLLGGFGLPDNFFAGQPSLKFTLYGEQFTTGPATVALNNDNYEFLQLNNFLGNFQVGEKVHTPRVSNAAGTISCNTTSPIITGSGTSFNTIYNTGVNNWITIFGSSNVFIGQISSITNATSLTLMTNPSFTNTAASHQQNQRGYVSFTAGNNIITGVGTQFANDFANGHSIVVYQYNGTNGVITDAFANIGIINATAISVPGAPWFSNGFAVYSEAAFGQVTTWNANNYQLYLNKSTANTTSGATRTSGNFLFSNSSMLVGQFGATANLVQVGNFKLDRMQPLLQLTVPSGSSINATANVFNNLGVSQAIGTVRLDDITSLLGTQGWIFSRSNEYVANPDGKKSFQINCTFNYDPTQLLPGTNTVYCSPCINPDSAAITAIQNVIAANTIAANTPIISPPNTVTVSNTTIYNGLAVPSYQTPIITLAEGMDSENLIAYIQAYQPLGTNIALYCKLLNNYDFQSFNAKEWTLMSLISGNGVFSSSTNLYDWQEYKFTIPNLPPVLPLSALTSGTVSVSNTTVNVAVSVTGVTFAGNSTYAGIFANGDLMVITSGNTSVLHQVNTVSNSTFLTLTQAPSITNTVATFSKAVDVYSGNGTISINSASANVTGTNTFFTSNFSNGSFLQIISGGNVQNVQINIVSNSTFMNLTSAPVLSNTVAQYGYFQFTNQAFLNYDNDGIVRYYNGVQAPYDTYKYYAFQLVMTSNASNIIPRVLNLRAVALSA